MQMNGIHQKHTRGVKELAHRQAGGPGHLSHNGPLIPLSVCLDGWMDGCARGVGPGATPETKQSPVPWCGRAANLLSPSGLVDRVRNLRAAGQATLRRGRRSEVLTARELPPRCWAAPWTPRIWYRRPACGTSEPLPRKAYLTTMLTRLCVDQLHLARRQREVDIGPWLPEPIVTEADAQAGDPERLVDTHKSISLAFLVLREQLQPCERAVFLLRETCEYEIAGMPGKSEARVHLRAPALHEQHRRLYAGGADR